jgi:hypothetical protein
MGTASESFVQLTERIGRKTGGLSVYPYTMAVRGREEPLAYVMVGGVDPGFKEDLGMARSRVQARSRVLASLWVVVSVAARPLHGARARGAAGVRHGERDGSSVE